MQSIHNEPNNSVSMYLDYDLISLSNTLAYSFEEGLQLASSMLNAPFFITNLYDYVIIRSEGIRIDDPAWTNIAETRFCNHMVIKENKNIYSVMIPSIGKMVYYSVNEPTVRQRQLAKYIAWIVSQFGKEQFYVSNSSSTPKSTLLFHLLNDLYDVIDNQSTDSLAHTLPKRMQILASFRNPSTDDCTSRISKICNNTEYVTLYKQKYRIFLFSALTSAQTEALSEKLFQHNIYAGLSYPFNNYKECRNHAFQAIAALNETVKRGGINHLALYENLFASDVLYNYSSDIPLSTFRHPLFLQLERYDRNNNSDLYNTLVAYIENSGNTQETAKQLSTHRNTVLYRLGQALKITGYNVQDPFCRASLLYAVTLERSLKKNDR